MNFVRNVFRSSDEDHSKAVVEAAAAAVSADPPAGMTTMLVGGLVLTLDEAAMLEYETEREKYDEIFKHVAECHSEAL